MKIDLKRAFRERNRIIWLSLAPIEFTEMTKDDVKEHRFWLEKIYRGLLHDTGVVDECCRRFEKIPYEWN